VETLTDRGLIYVGHSPDKEKTNTKIQKKGLGVNLVWRLCAARIAGILGGYTLWVCLSDGR